MPRHLATLVFTNVTPLWTGGPLGGATYNIVGDKIIGPWLPDAKSIIGRVRWLLRAAEASAQTRLGKSPSSLKDVDTIASRIFGDTSHASKIIIRVHAEPDPGLLPQTGCTKCYIPANPSFYNNLIQLAKDIERLPKRKKLDLAAMFEVDAFVEMRRRLELDSRQRLGKKSTTKYQDYLSKLKKHVGHPPRGLLTLMSIPRVRLLLQGTENVPKIVTHQPLPPRTVTLKIELYERLGSGLSPEEAQLATVAIAYTLAFLGIGKAASRGFGRLFLKEETVTSGPVENVSGILDWLMEGRLSSPRNAEYVFKGTGRWIVERVCRLLSPSQQCSSMPQEPALLRVPSLDVALSRARVVENVKHPCPYALLELTASNKPGCCYDRRPVAEIHDALSAIGRASMKVMWKLCSGEGVNERDLISKPGTNYHTWILGLPRQGKRRVCGREVVTGYQVAGYDLWAQEENCHTCGVEGVFSEARRASPVVVTTYCSSGGCYALLEPFATLDDFVDLLTGPRPLVHIGVHNIRIRNIRSPNPLVHVAGVYKIATSERLGANDCPRDEGGVMHPPSIDAKQKQRPRDAKETIVKALDASIEWLTFLLN